MKLPGEERGSKDWLLGTTTGRIINKNKTTDKNHLEAKEEHLET